PRSTQAKKAPTADAASRAPATAASIPSTRGGFASRVSATGVLGSSRMIRISGSVGPGPGRSLLAPRLRGVGDLPDPQGFLPRDDEDGFGRLLAEFRRGIR